MAQRRDKQLIKKISARIREIRTHAGVTQEQFYNDTEIHIGRLERAQLNIRVTTLKVVCDYFGMTLKEFFEPLE